MAHDVPHANDRGSHFRGSHLKPEMRSLVAQAREICTASGTLLFNVARIQQFHRTLTELPAAIDHQADEPDGVAKKERPLRRTRSSRSYQLC
jgi:hypothetical protein